MKSASQGSIGSPGAADLKLQGMAVRAVSSLAFNE